MTSISVHWHCAGNFPLGFSISALLRQSPLFFFSSLCSGGALAAAQSWTANTFRLALSTRLYPGQYIRRSSALKENNSPLRPPWALGLQRRFLSLLYFIVSCIFSVSAVSQKSRSCDDNLCCLPYLALIPCYGYERVSQHLHQFEPSPKVPAPGAQPLLIILTRTQHYNNSCHGSGKDQAGFSRTITTNNHLKEILMLINSPLIEY